MRKANIYTKKFYAIWGTNGAGVFDDWGYAQHARKYIRKSGIKKFSCFTETEGYALNILNEILPLDVQAPFNMRLNKLVFCSQLAKGQPR
ncbi:hypothetical protein [Marasmitruncus massiliensis]|uniref:hypothetical protein n=1 Tax=Marasmitruncus massiliensis TaxID=1944642 RepID=UPI000C7B4844|nr:hypothetical protein [Marasmitruncus massiliensis]